MDSTPHETTLRELADLMNRFFRAVSFEEGAQPPHEHPPELFIETGLLVKNGGARPEIGRLRQFIATPAGWRMSSMVWDDERPGLALADHVSCGALPRAA